MSAYDGSKAQQAHELLSLIQKLTAVSRDPHSQGFLLRITDAATGEALGHARASQDVANAVQAALESMLAYAEADRPEKLSSAAQDATGHSELAAAINDVFADIDPVALLSDVVDAPDPDASALAYEDLLGDVNGGDLL
jgi:hypothetical protein